ncbi:MAG: tetratricopeptide repeat protein [Bacteroidia bacterium]
MKLFIGILLTSIFTLSLGLDEAAAFFQQKKYKKALEMYEKALVAYPKKAQAIHYNMGICYQLMDSTEKAANLFHQVLEGEDSALRAAALNHLGIRNAEKNKLEDALAAFHKALLLNPNNRQARYNYELLLKRLPKQDQTPPQPKENPKEQEEEDENVSDNQSKTKTVEYWEEKLNINKPQTNENQPNKPFSDSIPMEKAIQLLEQMKKDEMKYLQQLRKSMSEEHRGKNQSQW